MSARGLPAVLCLASLCVLAALGGTATAPAAAPEITAIVGARVHTLGPAGTIEGGTVVIEEGRIRAVGKGIAVPAGARRIDAAGKVVTPGLFNSLTHLGLVEVNGAEGSQDTNVKDDQLTAAIDVTDALNPRSVLFPVNRTDGLTRALTAPENTKSLLSGRGAVIHLGVESASFLVRPRAAMFATLGETGAHRSGDSRADAMLRLREALRDALDYAANRAAYDRAARRPYALSRLDLEALQPVVHGQMPLVVAVNRASDIAAVLRLGEEFHLKLVLSGVAEGWLVAHDIAAAKVPVLVRPQSNLPARFESLAATLENAARLHAAGVAVAFMTGDAHNARDVRQQAGNAVAYGLPWQAALEALTVVPARVWGIADRYGTLEAGKDADVVVWDGDPLEVATAAEHVFIRGVEVPMKSRQTELRDRYKNLPGARR